MKSWATPFEAWLDYSKNEQPAVLATVMESSGRQAVTIGGRLFIAEDGLTLGSLGSTTLDRKAAKFAEEKLQKLYPSSQSYTLTIGEGESFLIFFDVNMPPTELILFGAGHDARPVASLAQQLGFRVLLVDQRPAFATNDRFPGAEINVCRPEHLAENIFPGKRSFIVIMNHHIEKDRMCLKFSLRSEAPYVGVLGPRKRKERLFAGLAEEKETFTEEALAKIYNPIGLDIGADTPEEVAISMLSEMIAVRNGHSGQFLWQKETIHDIT